MTRRAARISHDEVTRMVKAVQSCGLSVGRVIFDGATVSVVIGGDIGENPNLPLDQSGGIETVQNLDDYKAWRARTRGDRD